MLLPSRPCSRAVCTLEPPQPPESRARQSSCYTRKQIEVVNQDLEAAVGRLEGEWMKLAQEYRASGNLPFAVRALYLSSLAILADGGLLTLARGNQTWIIPESSSDVQSGSHPIFFPYSARMLDCLNKRGTARIHLLGRRLIYSSEILPLCGTIS